MGMALAVILLIGLLGSGITVWWIRLSQTRPADPDIASLLKQRRSNFENSMHTAEKQLLRKVVGETVDDASL